ncbi:MAG: protein phosphatase 2C domain-containing protein [Anaerolineae bacterium]|nr:protein phosphatase 2C domain-containing protein [Anaerolineae bacterium]
MAIVNPTLLTATNINILSIPAPISNRINEDAWLVLESAEPPGYVMAAVIDGAGARLTIPRLETALQQHHHGLTAAAFASTLARQSLIAQLNARPDLSLRAALLNANETLRQTIADYIGGFSLEHILNQTDGLSGHDDPRRIRLALPACVVTLVRLDCSNRQLEYAHAGDTGLLEIRHNGKIICHTSDQMGPYDENTLRLAARLCESENLPNFSDAVGLSAVQQMNVENGLRHNYVDTQGQTHPGEGCGVIDGLPELADYLECGTLAVDSEQTAGFCLLSDGLQLLAPLDETTAEKETRLHHMGTLLSTRGLAALFETLQKMIRTDIYYNQYPRLKNQDDATGVYVRISNR